MAQNVREKNNLQIDLHKVSTSRGQSFAPEEFTFNAPSNLSSFVFRPLSPNAAASFLNPSQDAGASFIGTDPKRWEYFLYALAIHYQTTLCLGSCHVNFHSSYARQLKYIDQSDNSS